MRTFCKKRWFVSPAALLLSAALLLPSFAGVAPGPVEVEASAAAGQFADVRDLSTGIRMAPSLITEVNTRLAYENILTDAPAIAIFTYRVINGTAKILFTDGAVTPDEALSKLSGKVVPAFRIHDNTDADSLAAFLKARNQKDAYVVSTDPVAVKRAYNSWNMIRGVMDYSSRTYFDPEALRSEALSNRARVVILPETASKEEITTIQDRFGCVWLAVSGGKSASVAATNKGPYGLITPDRSVTESCYKEFYLNNTTLRRTNVIGHRGNPSVAQENTIAGALTAYKNGATMVENDIYRVADGVLMVMHDKTIDRTTNGTGTVTSMTSAQLKRFVVNSKSGIATQPIPSLEEYFSTIKGNPDRKLVIEVKHPNTAFASVLASLINKYDVADQVVVISFTESHLSAIQALMPGIPVGLLNRITFDDTNPTATVETVLDSIQPYNAVCNMKYSTVSEGMLNEFIARGVTLWPWTINTQTDFDNLMVKGVGGVTTNYSQWSKTMVKDLSINSQGRVIATTYGGTSTDVTTSVEMVVVEDTLGISFKNGVVTVPKNTEGGKASYFFRCRSTTPTGVVYHTVTELVQVGSNEDSLLAMDDLQLAKNAFAVSTNTPLSSYSVAAEPFVQHQRYILTSAKYGYVMSYDPTQSQMVATTGSLKLDQDGDSSHTFYKSGNTIYMDHSERDSVLWVLRQYKEATGGNQIANWKRLQVTGKTYFGGNATYSGIELKKGIYGDDGVTYWSCVGGENEYRNLCYRSDSTPFKDDASNKAMTTAAERPKYIMESFGNCVLIYYRASANDYRFIYCDAKGNWGVRRYANNVAGCPPVSQVRSDFDDLKLVLYQHNRDASIKKKVAFEGYQTYTVNAAATADSVLKMIEKNIVVFDPNLKNLHIPCSGSEPLVGYYRLAFDRPFDPTREDTYTVNILYCAEANTLGEAPSDVVVGKLKVVMDHSDTSVIPGDELLATPDIQTTTPKAVYTRTAQDFVQDGRYLIASDKYGYVMSYAPAIGTAAGFTGSLATKVGNGTVCIEDSQRDEALWVVRQYSQATGGTQVADGKPMKTSSGANFGGKVIYAGTELQKSRYGDDGTTYWYSFGGRNEYSFLCYRSDSSPFKDYVGNKTQTNASVRPLYIMESFGDTYLLYYKASNKDYRIIFCDENGNWGVRRYADNVNGCSPVSQISKDLDKLKVRFYRYERNTAQLKSVAYRGYETYTVTKAVSAQTVLATIKNNITVFDFDMRDLEIPYYANAGKVGCYRLEFARGFDASVPGMYPVNIIYHSEGTALGAAATDVILGHVNVIVP